MKTRIRGKGTSLSRRKFIVHSATAGGGLALWIFGRRRSKSSGANDPSLLKLSEEEEARLEHLIAAESASEKKA